MEKMKPGEVVGPIRGPSGFQLLKLVEVRDASAASGGAHTVTEYHGRHILVRVDDHQTDAAAKAKIDTLRARIAGGADFETVAKESSEDNNSKGQGGDLGWFPVDAFGPAFGQQVAGIQDGDVSQPFRTDAGWHIVQRVATRQTDVTNDNQRAQIRETIGAASWKTSTTASCRNCVAKPMSASAAGTARKIPPRRRSPDRCAPSSLWYRASPPGSARAVCPPRPAAA